MQTTAHHAQVAADGWLRRGVYSLFDRMPQRPDVARPGHADDRPARAPAAGRRRHHRPARPSSRSSAPACGSSPGTSQSDKHRQPADGPAGLRARPRRTSTRSTATAETSRRAIPRRPRVPQGRLHRSSQIAEQNGYTAATCWPTPRPGRGRPEPLLPRHDVQPQIVALVRDRRPDGCVLGPDGAAYVLDNTINTVYRVDLADRRQDAVVGGQARSRRTAAGHRRRPAPADHRRRGRPDPRRLQPLWRWRPAAGDKTGRARWSRSTSRTTRPGARARGRSARSSPTPAQTSTTSTSSSRASSRS